MRSRRIRQLAGAAGTALALVVSGAQAAWAVDLWTETGQSLASANY
jgi:hypothetical protein